MTAARLHYELTGPEGAPVVVLSGSLGTDLSMWDPQASALARRYRVLRVDMRGHGGSEVPPGPYAIADAGGDLLALLDQLGLERVFLCGLSIGAMLSIWVAAHAPERVGRLILFCTTAQFPEEVRSSYRERAAAVRAHGLEPIADLVVARWFTPAFAQACPEVVAELRGQLTATSPEGYAGGCEALAAMDLLGDLGAIAAPTLVLAGADDPATPPEHGRRVAEGITGARFELIDDAAHLATVQQPDWTTARIAEFLG
jgi:3-oxoadipate enol-lactonase